MIKPTCFIFFYEGYIDIAPTINNLSVILDKQGFYVTIFATKDDIDKTERIEKTIRIISFKKKFFLEYLKKISSEKIFARILLKFSTAAVFSFQCLTEIFKGHYSFSEISKSHINIGVDFYGSVVALLYYFLFKQKYLFLSLELSEPRKGVFARLSASLARLAYEKSECVIVQERDRFEVLSEFYGYRHPQVFYLPNSPLNNTYCAQENTKNFFREKFNLSDEQFPYIVLQAGMINDISCARELAESFVSIDKGCALILHSPTSVNEFTEEMKYMQLLQQINSKNLFLSLNPVSYNQVDNLYKSSTIGLAFYNKHENNFTKIARASGKLAFYLKHSKPVLVSNLEGLSCLINKYKCGLVINNLSDPREIMLALDKILVSYDTYSENARACFDAEFSFERGMEPILSFMNQQI